MYCNDAWNTEERRGLPYSSAVDKRVPTKASSSCSPRSTSWSPVSSRSGTSSRCSDLQLAAVLIDVETERSGTHPRTPPPRPAPCLLFQPFQTLSKRLVSWIWLSDGNTWDAFPFPVLSVRQRPQCEASQGLLCFLDIHVK